MPSETHTQRQEAADKAAATRKRTAADHSAARTKASAIETEAAAQTAAHAAQETIAEASETASRRAEAATLSFDALVRQAQRAMVLIPVGAALEARDAAVNTVRTYTRPQTARREFNRFERRGEKALKRR